MSAAKHCGKAREAGWEGGAWDPGGPGGVTRGVTRGVDLGGGSPRGGVPGASDGVIHSRISLEVACVSAAIN